MNAFDFAAWRDEMAAKGFSQPVFVVSAPVAERMREMGAHMDHLVVSPGLPRRGKG